MNSFLIANSFYITLLLMIVAAFCFLPAIINQIYILSLVEFSSRDFIMYKLKALFPYEDNSFSLLKSRRTNKYYEVTRPRSFKVLGEEEIRSKFLDFNGQFVRNRVGLDRISY